MRDPLSSYPHWLYGASGARMFRSETEWMAADNTEDWYDSPVLVPPPKKAAEPVAIATRDVLVEQAAALGLNIDKRWSDQRLAEEIAKG